MGLLSLLEIVSKGPHVALHHFFIGECALPHEALDRSIGDIINIVLGCCASGQTQDWEEQNGQNRKKGDWFHLPNLKDLPQKATREEWTRRGET